VVRVVGELAAPGGADAGLGGQMEDLSHVLEHGPEIQVLEAAFDETERAMVAALLEVALLRGPRVIVREGVDAGDLMAGGQE
jgi:hypothetical protein